MRANVMTFLAGAVFAVGLGVSGMTLPSKVIGFLDASGGWDPSLAFVMVGAIGMHLLLYRGILKRGSPVFAEHFGIPTRRDITPRLVGGAALFGVGWALAGVCPGPGLVTAASGSVPALVFVGTMSAGMALFHVVEVALRRPQPALMVHPEPRPVVLVPSEAR